MSDNQGIYNVANKILQNKVYEYDGKFFHTTSASVKFKFKFKIVGDMTLKHMGEPHNHIAVELIITEIENPVFSSLFDGFDGDDIYQTRYDIEYRWYYLIGKIKDIIWNELKYFSLTDTPEIVKIVVEDPYLPKEDMKQITEAKSEKRNVVRQVVFDIIKVFKEEGDGEYNLPSDLNGEDYYEFPNMTTSFDVELRIQETDEIEGFEVEGGQYEDDDVIEIEIIYNPNSFPKMYYDLVGELNEVVRHELQHIIQVERGDENVPDESSSRNYYMAPHELDAQVAGFKRYSKLRRQPFEKTVRDWFEKNKIKRGLDDNDVEEIINALLNRYNGNR
jgi:hypothetical protein